MEANGAHHAVGSRYAEPGVASGGPGSDAATMDAIASVTDSGDRFSPRENLAKWSVGLLLPEEWSVPRGDAHRSAWGAR